MCNRKHFLRHLGKKKPKIEQMHWAFSTFVFLFLRRNGQYFVSAFFVQIVFATPYYTDETLFCQAFIGSSNPFLMGANAKIFLRKNGRIISKFYLKILCFFLFSCYAYENVTRETY